MDLKGSFSRSQEPATGPIPNQIYAVHKIKPHSMKLKINLTLHSHLLLDFTT
jgi:hypothetical protein